MNPLCAITLAIGIAGLVFANAQTNAGLNWFATVTSLLSQGTGDRQPLVPADAIGDYRSAASGNWNAITTWESFNGTSWIPAVATPTSADGIVTIRSGHTVTISASGLSYDQVVVDAGGQVTVAATITHTLANGVGTDLIVNGTWLNQGGIWTVTGATWAVVAGGSFVHNTTAGIATPLGVVTLDPASTFIYRGSSTLTPSSAVSGRTYGNLSFESTAGSWTASESGAGTLTVNGDFSIGSGVTYSTTQTGAMTFAGSFTNNGTLTNSTGTQIYTFTGSGKTIGGSGAISFETLNINNGASITATTAVTEASAFTATINGLLAINAVFTNNGTMNVNGTFQINQGGSGSGTNFVYGGSSTLVFNNSSGSFAVNGDPYWPGANGPQNVTVQGGGGITLNVARTIPGILTLTNGNITTGTNILTLDSAATTAGGSSSSFVIGTLKKNAVPAGSFTFPLGVEAISGHGSGYTPLELTNATGGGDLTVVTNHAVQGMLDTNKTLNEYWSLTLNSGSLTTDLTFNYLDTDVNGSEGNYELIVVEGGNATHFPNNGCPGGANCVDTSANTATKKSVQSFSDWTVGEPAAPTAVKLASFTAVQNNGEIELEWRTGYEARNLGYNVYREQDGKRAQLTRSLIAGSALIAARQTKLTAGLSYTWYDHLGEKSEDSKPQAAAVSYWLEDVDLNGTRTLHGPIIPWVNYTKQKHRNPRAELMSEVSRQAAGAGLQFNSWPVIAPAEQSLPQSERQREKALASDPINVQRQIAGVAGVKIAVSKGGWYRVTRPELQAAGLDTDDAELLQLYVNGQELAIRVSGDGRHFTASDYFEFYGQALDSPTDAAQTYYLIRGNTPGRRIRDRFSAGSSEPNGAPSFPYTVERKERMIYFPGLLNGEEENFFGQVISATPVSATIPATQLDQTSAEPVRLEIALQGVANQNHLVRVSLNDIDIGTMSFANTEHPRQTFTVPAAALHEGDNTVALTSLAGGADISLLDTIRLTYAHKYVADANKLSFTTNNQQSVRVTGFSNKKIRALDITDPYNLDELKPLVTQLQRGNYAADIQVAVATWRKPRRVFVFTDDQTIAADRVSANFASSWWSQTAGADYLIITTRDLAGSVEALARLRRNQGMVVRVVDVEDLYDEFSFGVHSPQAINDFLKHALNTWKGRPDYALFVGDASYDPKNYFGQGLNDLVPTKLIDTALAETASDDWLADCDADGVADLALGRLPVRTANEADTLVRKIINYENTAADPARGALLVSDLGFDGTSRALQSLLPSELPLNTISRGGAEDAIVHSQVIAALNQGPLVANYVGHGSNGVWTGAPILSSEDAPSLTNADRLTVFTMMTCFNGYFHDAYSDSLSEALLKSPGGAVAVWSSTTLTAPAGQNAINQQFYRLLFAPQPLALGDAARRAKTATADVDVRRTWTFFGDPAMRLR